ncbi:13805_t:CDS:2 [Cetraspora pellucida]|uniref:13805_t:CDS:1 n=1 Tax=Cetraspora pellucida TaxID=1433469 RepID=A0ACA9MV10_9GLOM|nr:13805_t:CDS:2 [Cetraspora pellucida]
MESRLHKIKEKLDLSDKNQFMVDNVVEALKMIKLKYYPGEKDLLVLYHEFEIKLKNGDKVTKTSKLITDGIFGSTETYTAMAKTVGLPAAIATEMIARGEIHDKGVLAPTLPNIYKPILENLDYEGIKIEESIIEKGMRENLKWSGSGIWN